MSPEEEWNHELRLIGARVERLQGALRTAAESLEYVAGHLPAGDVRQRAIAAAQEARDYGVHSVPTLILFKDGLPVRQTVGFQGEQRIRNFISGNTPSNEGNHAAR